MTSSSRDENNNNNINNNNNSVTTSTSISTSANVNINNNNAIATSVNTNTTIDNATASTLAVNGEPGAPPQAGTPRSLADNASALASMIGGGNNNNNNTNADNVARDVNSIIVISNDPGQDIRDVEYDPHGDELPTYDGGLDTLERDEEDDDDEYEDEDWSEFLIELAKLVWDHLLTSIRHIISRSRPGRDYYTPIFLIDFTCFAFLIVFQQWFTGNSSDTVADFLEQSVIPRNYVGMLLAQFGLIILDRGIYLYRSVKIKLVLQVVLAFVYNIIMFFYFPDLNHVLFEHAWPLIIFYLLKCAYLYFSALQICYGYPVYVTKSAFMESYGDFENAVFSVYRAIPFVFEIATLLEWIVTDTTLLFYDWLKCEDIFALLYQVKCRNEWIKRQGRKKGAKQPVVEKCTTGVLLFIVLVFVIWFPLIILSSGLPGSLPNPVNNIDMSVGVMGWDPLYKINQDFSGDLVNGSVFRTLRKNTFITSDDSSNTQILVMPNASESVWAITPPGRAALLASLSPYSLAKFTVSYTFTRNQSLNNIISGTNTVILPPTSTIQLIQVLNGTSDDPVRIPELYPRYVRLPGVSGAARYQGNMVDALLFLRRGTYTVLVEDVNHTVAQEWWELQQTSSDDRSPELFPPGPPMVVTISTTMPSAITSTLVSAGIIGLYVGVVLSVGRFLRMYVTGITLRIWTENLPCCDDLIRMCHDIFIARQYGDLMLEEELYHELIEIFRSPETLIEKTKLKQD